MTATVLNLAAEQQKLLEFAASGHPSWFVGVAVTKEMLIGFAVLFDRARRQIDHYFDMTYATRARRGAATDPDWLDGLAREVGSHRFASEADPALQDRIRSVPAVVTRPQILAAVQELLAGAGVIGTVATEQVPAGAAYCLTKPALTSDANGHGFTFTPATDSLAHRIASTKPFGFVLIVPADTSESLLVSLRTLLDEIKAAGYSAFVEVTG